MEAYYKEREIKNPVLRFCVIAFLIIATTITEFLFLISSPLWFPIDFVLKKIGRKGFLQEVGESLLFHFKGGFQRRQ